MAHDICEVTTVIKSTIFVSVFRLQLLYKRFPNIPVTAFNPLTCETYCVLLRPVV